MSKPVTIKIRPGSGYLLSSRKTGNSIGLVDRWFAQREVFKQVPREEGKLLVILTHNTRFDAEGDATICCSFGIWRVDTAAQQIKVLPQRWWNEGVADVGYQWITRLAVEPTSGLIIGDGIRISPFVLDASGLKRVG